MQDVLSIYDAKTNLSKLIKKAKAGETIYVGAYGKPEVIIAPAPKKKEIKIGIWAHKAKKNAYKDEDLIGPDQDLIAWSQKDDPLLK